MIGTVLIKPKTILLGEKIFRKHVPSNSISEKESEHIDSKLVFRNDSLSSLYELLEFFITLQNQSKNQSIGMNLTQIKQTTVYQIQNQIQLIQNNPYIGLEFKKELGYPNIQKINSSFWIENTKEVIQKEIKKKILFNKLKGFRKKLNIKKLL